MPQTSPPPAARLDAIDGLRALAALYVTVFHAQLMIWTCWYGNDPPRWLWLTNCGHYAVSVFIVVSGFCLMMPVVRHGELRGGFRTFIKRRALRILPPYYIALALTLLLIALLIHDRTGTTFDNALPVSWQAILSNLLMQQDWWMVGRINGAFWSLAVEWWIYFLFPLLLLLWWRVGPLWSTAITVTAFAWLSAFLGHGWAEWMMWHYVGLFALGMCAAEIAFTRNPAREGWRTKVPWAWLAGAGVLAMALALIRWDYNVHYEGMLIGDLWVGLMAGCALVAATTGKGNLFSRVLGWKPLAFLGAFSYSLYLVHAPLQQVWWQYIVRPFHLPQTGQYLMLVGATPLLILVAYGFYRMAEKPFIDMRAAIKAKDPAPVIVPVPETETA